jgi:hypothetical protein
VRVKEVAGENHPFESVSRTSGSSEDDPALIEMASLPADRTGVEGVIHISTAQARHAPRVTWYPGRPKDKIPCLSVTIEPLPQAFNHHLPARVFEAASMPVKAWVALNNGELLDFWDDGSSWMDYEVDVFKRGLKKLS